MPVVILVDVSLSTAVQCEISGISYQHKMLTFAKQCVGYLKTQNTRVCVATFASSFSVLQPFGKDYDSMLSELDAVTPKQECPKLHEALLNVQHMVLSDLGSTCACQVVVFTDGQMYDLGTPRPPSCLPLSIPSELHVLAFKPPSDLITSIVEENGGCSKLWVVPYSMLAAERYIQTFCKSQLQAQTGVLSFGGLSSIVDINPRIPGITSARIPLAIQGFLDMANCFGPAFTSKHTIICTDFRSEAKDVAQKEATFCALLHGAFMSVKTSKSISMCALVLIEADRYALITTYLDSRKKSNLLLSVLQRGEDAIPWIGNLSTLLPDSYLKEKQIGSVKPPLPLDRPVAGSAVTPACSYNQSACLAWLHPHGIQAETQKLLRLTKKLPEKRAFIERELDRIIKLASSLSLWSYLISLSILMNRESEGAPNAEAKVLLAGYRTRLASAVPPDAVQ